MSATASVQTERTPWGEVEFEERKEAELIQFSRVGETIQGVLVKMEPVEIKDKKTGSLSKTIAYFLNVNKDGRIVKVHGTFQINQKIRPDDLGRIIRISYRGEDKELGRQGNALRKFEVLVDKKLPKQSDLVITDADIPF